MTGPLLPLSQWLCLIDSLSASRQIQNTKQTWIFRPAAQPGCDKQAKQGFDLNCYGRWQPAISTYLFLFSPSIFGTQNFKWQGEARKKNI